MKYLIIGLGNPGAKYVNTRHNIGFKVLDYFADLFKLSFSDERYASVCELNFRGKKIILVKPNTFMNLSGKAVLYWMKKTKVLQQNILIVTDDISLPFGVLRLRKKGSSGGHNGLNNVQHFLASSDYPRLRFGIGNNFSRGRQAEYVLANFTDEDFKILDERIEMTIKMIQGFIVAGIDQTMSNYNGK